MKNIEDERCKIKVKITAYKKEKRKIATEGNDDESTHLNFGGQKISTKRSTLCQVKGSLLATMLTGRREGRNISIERMSKSD